MSDQQELFDRIDSVHASINSAVGLFAAQNRRRGFQLLAGAAAIVVAIAVGVGGILATRASDTVNARYRVTSCDQYNVQQRSVVDKIDHHDLAWSFIFAPLPRSKAMQTLVSRDLGQLHTSNVMDARFRDCSPSGIHDYLHPHGTHNGYLPPTTKGS